MRIGIDFDNTIICYDNVFRHLAHAQGLIPATFPGNKTAIRDHLREMPEGDTSWQKLQGKAYGLEINHARIFDGFKDFIAACNAKPDIELFIVSHKTEFGHFDETRTSLRTAAREWLRAQNFFTHDAPYIKEENVYFETTREEKIERIKALKCTHFIDDLVEVLDSPLFPNDIDGILFKPSDAEETHQPFNTQIKHTFAHWREIQHALLGQ